MLQTLPQTARRVAVIGGGIAGLGAAWTLSRRHHVTVYERRSRLGGHANTVTLDCEGGEFPVDTGFIVYNEPNYPNLVALFDAIGVSSVATDMSFGVSLDGGRLEYSGTDLRGLFAQPANALRLRFWQMLGDIRRFYGRAAGYLEAGVEDISIAELLRRENYSDAFVDDHLIPMAAAIWSASVRDIGAYPAAAFIRFFDNHGLLNLRDRPQWRTVAGGSREYVRRLAQAPFTVRENARVAGVSRTFPGVAVRETNGRVERYDAVVIATHADEALELLADPSPGERAVLGTFAYSKNQAYLHEDERFMPRRRAAWASWNYLHDAATKAETSPLCVTYWMNRLQRLPTQRDIFVTLNPPERPRDARTHGVYAYDHPVFTSKTSLAQEESVLIQGCSDTWFCGSYLGHGFHEDALQSGLWVAEQLGCERPWMNGGGFDRLPQSYREPPMRPPLALSA